MVGKFGLKLRMALTGTILFAFYAAIGVVAYVLFGAGVIPLVIVGSVLLAGFQYKFGKWMALKSVGAEDMPESGRYADIHRAVEEYSRDMGIDKPRLMVAQMGVPNAFAVGRKAAGVVVVSEELIQLLDQEEVEGVLAHELAHISNRDVVMMVLGQSLASLVGMVVQWGIILSGDNDIADFFLGMIAGTIAQMIVIVFLMAISRYREYVADGDAAQTTGRPEALASALEKISSGAEAGESNLDDSVSALCIFDSERGLLKTIFATHPPVEKRIQRLRSA